MSRVLAVDLGTSGCRAALFVDGERVREAERPGASGLADPEGPSRALAVTAEVADEVVSGGVDVLAAGMAGLALAPVDAGELARQLARQHRAEAVVLGSDMTTSHIGALAGAAGVVIAAGTGAVALAVSATGGAVRVDGLGYLLGDSGSGYEIGRRGLVAALRAHDGRRWGSDALRELAERRFGDLDTLPTRVHGDDNPARLIAGFAPDVLQAATDGDAYAVSLWRDAGRNLACTAAAATARAGLGDPADVATTGGLFGAGALLTDPFEAELARQRPEARCRAPEGDALDGAYTMATRRRLPHEPLLTRIDGTRT